MKTNTIPVLRPAPTDLEIHPLIGGRWSGRAIDASRTLDIEIVHRIFEAARWAPSSFNNQPWRFLAFGPENPEALEKARSVLMRGNAWALAAPRLFFVLSRNDGLKGGATNPRAGYEAGMAAAMLVLQAAHEGLIAHQMSGFSADRLREIFSIPSNFSIFAALAIGWPGSVENLPSEDLQKKESQQRTRVPLQDSVFYNGEIPKE